MVQTIQFESRGKSMTFMCDDIWEKYAPYNVEFKFTPLKVIAINCHDIRDIVCVKEPCTVWVNGNKVTDAFWYTTLVLTEEIQVHGRIQ